ncbi:ferrodoxin-NADP(+) reductase [Capsaspora owczarzaki ATCC 30864]|uniref:NADPH:adrenodoxin oxidoreductase, mitochondrial n=1 Tax=Capsaspora owczarzaki (strain ATCC 30864) TaxID=595528 RepID=A0A0D2VNG7_CAPO3|nr:ferrodoxin-NADP(+) reductase [Capsaspora owczarzaki ATCC 30864]KJE91862.1 ferrodoxin-NADP(+) reductase [Capsaspora owczarzaki ATCC 30864]|eukprot:XP_004363770.1 ferrodoxin-NADP(+) reductase [Capsaspora owczarzaki ATCC 30864]
MTLRSVSTLNRACASVVASVRPQPATEHHRRRLASSLATHLASRRAEPQQHQQQQTPAKYSIAIVGGGPAGFYVAHHLLKHRQDITVDIFERLRMPFGLVRYGVAPDHPEVKNVTNTFEQVLANDRTQYFGNVEVGKDIGLKELQSLYSGVVLTYGAESDQLLSVPGEFPGPRLSDNKHPSLAELHQADRSAAASGGVISARSFVGWYNGHPDQTALNPSLTRGDTAVVFGQGNVSLDIARMLLAPIDALQRTDMADHALAELRRSTIKRVVLVGRRGPLEVAFTIKELREMTKLPGVASTLKRLELTPEEVAYYNNERPRRRLTELLVSTSEAAQSLTLTPDQRRWELLFQRMPDGIVRDAAGNVTGVRLRHTALQGAPGSRSAVALEQTEFIPCSLVIRSIGYRSLALPELPFDARRGIIPNIKGRVVTPSQPGEPTILPGLYCAGWVKHGPLGIIATTMNDSFATSSLILDDITKQALPPSPVASSASPSALPQFVFNKQAFLAANATELAAGTAQERPRIKMLHADPATLADAQSETAHGAN